jgi:hypothetical protein
MKNLFRVILSLFGLLFFSIAQGQDAAPVNIFGIPIIRCGTVEAEEELRNLFPKRESIEDFEKWLAPNVLTYKAQKSGVRSVQVLPIVFHIIHNGENVGSGANISSDLVYHQIKQLNFDFRKVAGTSGDNNNAVGADTEIEFCPATFDPDGNLMAVPGINRINRNDMGWTAPPYTRPYVQSSIKPDSQWDPNRYINIWVVQLSGTLLGYAQFPNSSGLDGLDANNGIASTDGVVIIPSSVGSTEFRNPNGGVYDSGRTLTHELGHFFGLRHIWGDGAGCSDGSASTNCACSLDDFCDDTPNAGRANYGCPNAETCGSVDMKENYMDYTNDACMNIFTEDQKVRMKVVMSLSPRRSQLLSSSECNGNYPLSITCPGNLVRNSLSNSCGNNVTYDPAQGTGGLFIIEYSHNSGTFFPVGMTTVTATLTDINENTTSCSFTITVNDITPPLLNCPSTVNVVNDPGECGAIVTYPLATASDNCGVGPIMYSQNSGTFFPVGTTNVMVSVMDVNGNPASCNFNVIVADNEPPAITCSDGSVIFNGEEEFILDPDDYTTYSDNCGIQSVILNPAVITCEDLGQVIQVNAVVTDLYNNTNDCTFSLEVLGLPCGWSFSPDGINCPGGNDVTYSVPLDEFYIQSTNCYYGTPFDTDVMGFAQYNLCGNGTLTAHVTSISGTSLGWAGLVMREDNLGGAKKVQLMTNRSNFGRREVRFTAGGTSFPQQFMNANRYWLRLTRSGNQFSGFVSPNGVNWYFVMAANVMMNSCIEIGLVATNYSSNSIVTATFGNVTVDEAMALPYNSLDHQFTDQSQGQYITVFPNPTGGELFIDLSSFLHDRVDMETLDQLGRSLDKKQLTSVQNNLESVSFQGYPAGVYYLRFIVNNSEVFSQKVIYTGGSR